MKPIFHRAAAMAAALLLSGGAALPVSAAAAGPQTFHITTTSLPDGTVGVPYSATIRATGESPSDYGYSCGYVPDRSAANPGGFPLPAGLNYEGYKCAIDGTPTAAGTRGFTATATTTQPIQHRLHAYQRLSITIRPSQAAPGPAAATAAITNPPTQPIYIGEGLTLHLSDVPAGGRTEIRLGTIPATFDNNASGFGSHADDIIVPAPGPGQGPATTLSLLVAARSVTPGEQSVYHAVATYPVRYAAPRLTGARLDGAYIDLTGSYLGTCDAWSVGGSGCLSDMQTLSCLHCTGNPVYVTVDGKMVPTLALTFADPVDMFPLAAGDTGTGISFRPYTETLHANRQPSGFKTIPLAACNTVTVTTPGGTSNATRFGSGCAAAPVPAQSKATPQPKPTQQPTATTTSVSAPVPSAHASGGSGSGSTVKPPVPTNPGGTQRASTPTPQTARTPAAPHSTLHTPQPAHHHPAPNPWPWIILLLLLALLVLLTVARRRRRSKRGSKEAGGSAG